MMKCIIAFMACLLLVMPGYCENSVRLKEVARVAGVRDNPLTGYGLVFGLSGSGDSPRNKATLQSVANTLKAYGVNVALEDLSSRNVAAVLVTAKLPAFSEPGQMLDVLVSSAGDARSLNGGTLLLTPLFGPDGKAYAIAQGAISVGGYQFEAETASVQKNHPTVGVIPSGASVEQSPVMQLAKNTNQLSILLNTPDFTMANRVVLAINKEYPQLQVHAEHAGKVSIDYPTGIANIVSEVSKIENIFVNPERKPRIVINERTGTVVSGGDVRLGKVSISQGDLRVEISTEYSVSQPDGIFLGPSRGIRSIVIPNSKISTQESIAPLVTVPEGASVADLLAALRGIRLPTRNVIAVLQAIKAAGALDGELVIQ